MNDNMAAAWAASRRLRECPVDHRKLWEDAAGLAEDLCAETHADIRWEGVRLGVLAALAVALAAWLWQGRWGR